MMINNCISFLSNYALSQHARLYEDPAGQDLNLVINRILRELNNAPIPYEENPLLSRIHFISQIDPNADLFHNCQKALQELRHIVEDPFQAETDLFLQKHLKLGQLFFHYMTSSPRLLPLKQNSILGEARYGLNRKKEFTYRFDYKQLPEEFSDSIVPVEIYLHAAQFYSHEQLASNAVLPCHIRYLAQDKAIVLNRLINFYLKESSTLEDFVSAVVIPTAEDQSHLLFLLIPAVKTFPSERFCVQCLSHLDRIPFSLIQKILEDTGVTDTLVRVFFDSVSSNSSSLYNYHASIVIQSAIWDNLPEEIRKNPLFLHIFDLYEEYFFQALMRLISIAPYKQIIFKVDLKYPLQPIMSRKFNPEELLTRFISNLNKRFESPENPILKIESKAKLEVFLSRFPPNLKEYLIATVPSLQRPNLVISDTLTQQIQITLKDAVAVA